VLLTLLALAAPLPAFAISNQAFEPVTAAPGPAAISVSTSLDSCGVLNDNIVCKLDVSFNPIANADTYSATVTRADGSVIDYGGVGAGGTSLWVPYVGAGNYSVRITAYGQPETANDPDGHGDVIATGTSRTGQGNDRTTRNADQRHADTSVTGRNPSAQQNTNPDGTSTSSADASAAAVTPACTEPVAPTPAPPVPPEEPPQDLDPDNPDEDADGIPDDQERVTYEQQLAEYQAALAAQAQTPAPAAVC
jgi:hypothetical protein